MKRLPALLLLVASLVLTGCQDKAKEAAKRFTGGDPDKGKAAIDHYGCAGCHTIPGVRNANALVGPPLNQIASRSYIGGVVENTPDNMIRWIQDPHAFSPNTAMPNLHVTPTDAQDITSYLYTLR